MKVTERDKNSVAKVDYASARDRKRMRPRTRQQCHLPSLVFCFLKSSPSIDPEEIKLIRQINCGGATNGPNSSEVLCLSLADVSSVAFAPLEIPVPPSCGHSG